MMKRILLFLVMVLSTVAFSACMQQKAEDTITRYCRERPDEFPGYEPVSFDKIAETYSNPDFIPAEPDADGESELYDKVFCLDLKLTRITRVSDRW